MTWAMIAILAAHSIWLHRRVKIIARDVRRLGLVWHEAANRSMRRHRRDQWRFREIDAALRDLALAADPTLDIPDIEAGPPDDPDSA